MICDLSFRDLDRMLGVINGAAQAYKGVIFWIDANNGELVGGDQTR